MNGKLPVHLVWFKRDLRVADHRPLFEATRSGPALGLYIIEPGLWSQPDASERQWLFIRDSLAELREDLAAIGVPLLVRRGEAIEVLESLRSSLNLAALYAHEETGNAWTFERDKAVGRWARSQGLRWTEYRQFGVERGPSDRAGWARRWEDLMAEPILPEPKQDACPELLCLEPGKFPSPSELGLSCQGAALGQKGGQKGGRTEGSATLDSFLRFRGRAYHKELSSPNTAFDSCSRLSAHLAYGTLSLREVLVATRTRQQDVKRDMGADPSWKRALSAFDGRLHWHCHFIQKLEDSPDHEFRCVHSAFEGLRVPGSSPQAFQAWVEGRTGFPLIDACMRALNSHGWINFRMRALLVSFASYHLWLHWRETGEHLARQFTDYEPGIHWNQMQMQSGTTGINTLRIYNPVKQSYDQDETGRFIRKWVPELRQVPLPVLHEPWRLSPIERRDLSLCYPDPIVDHLAAAREARARIGAIRKQDGFHAEADGIQQRHGSRRSGLPPSGRRRTGPRKAANQLTLGL
ncbi:MAG: FAD-binding domain-containing protein [Magnetovibrionaceae bacterium]